MPTRLRTRPAFILADTIIGLIVAGVLGLVLVVALTKSGQAHLRLDDSATAVRIAQRVLSTLHAGHPAPQQLDGATITLTPTPGGTQVPNHSWVQVQVTYNGRQASLVGLVPQGVAQ